VPEAVLDCLHDEFGSTIHPVTPIAQTITARLSVSQLANCLKKWLLRGAVLRSDVRTPFGTLNLKSYKCAQSKCVATRCESVAPPLILLLVRHWNNGPIHHALLFDFSGKLTNRYSDKKDRQTSPSSVGRFSQQSRLMGDFKRLGKNPSSHNAASVRWSPGGRSTAEPWPTIIIYSCYGKPCSWIPRPGIARNH